MHFTMTGRIKDSDINATIEWTNGELSGEPLAVALAKGLAEAYEKVGVWLSLPEGPAMKRDYIKSPYIAAKIIGEIMQPYSMHYEGDVPGLKYRGN